MKLAASWVQCVAQLGGEASRYFRTASRLEACLNMSAAFGAVTGPKCVILSTTLRIEPITLNPIKPKPFV